MSKSKADQEIEDLEDLLALERAAGDAEMVECSVKIQGITEKLYCAMAQRERRDRRGDDDKAFKYDKFARDACEKKITAARARTADDLVNLKRKGNKDEGVRKAIGEIRPRELH